MDPPPLPEEPPARDWSLLPLDALSSVFVRVGAIDVLMGAGLVCRSWLQAAKLPDVWRVVDMENHQIVWKKCDSVMRAMAKAAVDRSDGQLQVFAGKRFVTHELMEYILDRSPFLTSLRLVSFYDAFSKPFVSAIRESPLMMELRSLDLVYGDLTVGELTDFLEYCPVLEVLRVRNCFVVHDGDEHALRSKFPSIKTMTLECDDDFCYDSDSDDYDFDHVPDFEDERTDDGSL